MKSRRFPKPTIVYSAVQTRWHELPDGSLLLDVDGQVAHLHRSPETGLFHFDHDSLVGGARDGFVRELVADRQGTFQAFRIGPLWFRVERHLSDRDVYVCQPMSGRPKVRTLYSIPVKTPA